MALIRQYRYPVDRSATNCPPVAAGTRAARRWRASRARNCARRSAATAGSLEAVTWFYSSSSISDEVCHIFLALDVTLDQDTDPEPGEHIECCCCPRGEALALVRRGRDENGHLRAGDPALRGTAAGARTCCKKAVRHRATAVRRDPTCKTRGGCRRDCTTRTRPREFSIEAKRNPYEFSASARRQISQVVSKLKTHETPISHPGAPARRAATSTAHLARADRRSPSTSRRPRSPVYVQPACPVEGYLWTPGYWAYGDDGLLLGRPASGSRRRARLPVDAGLLGLRRRRLRFPPAATGVRPSASTAA